MKEDALTALREVIQEDAGGRGLGADPQSNLFTICKEDFAAACRSLAETSLPACVGIVTGFYIPTATPPAAETDGPPGALFLARALVALGFDVVLIGEDWLRPALEEGLAACSLLNEDNLIGLPPEGDEEFAKNVARLSGPLTHLIAVEKVGPGHTPESLRAQGASEQEIAEFESLVAPGERGRCRSMRGRDLTSEHLPVHLLFEDPGPWQGRPVTIGIGDGGNEIGMGKVPWGVIRKNIPNGGLIACRVPADYLIVAGVSNWGAQALAAGVCLLRGKVPEGLFDPAREEKLLKLMVEAGPLVDGVVGRQEVSVDGLPWGKHAEVIERLGKIVGA